MNKKCFLLGGLVIFLSGMFYCAVSTGIEIPDVQFAALDQPQINMTLRRTYDGTPLGYDFLGSRYICVQAYFDTGASGIMLSKETVDQLGIVRSTHNGTTVIYSDVGVGGTDDFYVSEPLYASFAAFNAGLDTFNPAVFTQRMSTPVRLQVGITPSQDFTEPIDVVGMPAMMGKVVVMDPRPVNNFVEFLANPDWGNMSDDFQIHTYLYDPGTPFNSATQNTNPGIPATNFKVRLSYGNFERFTTVTPTGAAGPTLAHNPFIGPDPVAKLSGNTSDTTPGITISLGGINTTGSFLLDTGAATSMISTQMAATFGIRYKSGTTQLERYNPATGQYEILPDQFTTTVGGVGGTTSIAGFYLDSLLVPTIEAANPYDKNDLHNLCFTHAPVFVHDITLQDPITSQTLTLDGIFGMNYLVASAELYGELGFGTLSTGVFDWIVFDEQAGILGLALSNIPIPEPASLGLVAAAVIFYLAYYRRKLCPKQ